MNKGIQFSVAALALAAGSLLSSAPANAERFGFSYGPRGGIGFSYESGGYCDTWGCPDDFWDYPIAYCPVYYDGDWYRGPFYYRYSRGTYYYWIHGDWRRDEWRYRRPDDACIDRFGPPLGYDFYISHGFVWHDEWRTRWFHRHHRDHDGDHDHRHDGDHGDHGGWDRGGDHGRVWDHSGDHNGDRGGASAGDQRGGETGGATGSPTDLGSHRHGDSFGRRGGTIGAPAPESTDGGDRFRGGESGGHHHDGSAPSNDSSAPRNSGGHPPDGGGSGGGTPPPASSNAPSSSGDVPRDGGKRGDDGGGRHHTQTP